MPTKEPPDPTLSVGNLIATELRLLREGSGLAQEAFGKIIGAPVPAVSKLEHAKQHLNKAQAAKLDRKFGTGGRFARMVGLEERGRRLQVRSLDYTVLEERARTLKIYDALLVPGLLQTEDYARALIAAGGEPSDVAERAIQSRMDRQELLRRVDPPLIFAIVSESVLDWPVGDDAVMAGQLRHLLEVGRLPHVNIRVVPRSAGAFLGLDGSFKVVSTEDGHIGYAEAPGAKAFTFSLEALPNLDRFDRIGVKALSDSDSAELIGKKASEYGGQADVAEE
jgi:transcriptional regulator with XRE-family HTH domain